MRDSEGQGILVHKGGCMKFGCYKCVHRRSISGDAHSRCNNVDANVKGNVYGIRSGWFIWPLNFDPVWLEACDGFSDKSEENKPDEEADL